MEHASEVSGHQRISDRADPQWRRALAASELPQGHSRVVNLAGHTIALFNSDGRLFAVDNRCPHMGFPLDRGSLAGC
jgi:nitrite reductase/ring-hydroxylating ferredoxin subunit